MPGGRADRGAAMTDIANWHRHEYGWRGRLPSDDAVRPEDYRQGRLGQSTAALPRAAASTCRKRTSISVISASGDMAGDPC